MIQLLGFFLFPNRKFLTWQNVICTNLKGLTWNFHSTEHRICSKNREKTTPNSLVIRALQTFLFESWLWFEIVLFPSSQTTRRKGDHIHNEQGCLTEKKTMKRHLQIKIRKYKSLGIFGLLHSYHSLVVSQEIDAVNLLKTIIKYCDW